jgi:hypothetical protein
VIHISRYATRLTSPVIRFFARRAARSIGDSPQYVAPTPHRSSIKANRMELAKLPTKPSCPTDAKKIFGNIFEHVAKNKNAALSSGVHIL